MASPNSRTDEDASKDEDYVPNQRLLDTNEDNDDVSNKRRKRRPYSLTKNQEIDLVDYIEDQFWGSYPLKEADVLDQMKLGCEVFSLRNRFVDNRPTAQWLRNLKNRHQDRYLSQLLDGNVQVFVDDLLKNRQGARVLLSNKNCLDLLEDPSRIFLCHTMKISVPYKQESVIVVTGYNARGDQINPYVMYPNEGVLENLNYTIEPDYHFRGSKSGEFSPINAVEVVKTLSSLVEQLHIVKPVAIFTDFKVTLPIWSKAEAGGAIVIQLSEAEKMTLLKGASVGAILEEQTAMVLKRRIMGGRWNHDDPRVGYNVLVTIIEMVRVYKKGSKTKLLVEGLQQLGLFPFDSSVPAKLIWKHSEVMVNKYKEPQEGTDDENCSFGFKDGNLLWKPIAKNNDEEEATEATEATEADQSESSSSSLTSMQDIEIKERNEQKKIKKELLILAKELSRKRKAFTKRQDDFKTFKYLKKRQETQGSWQLSSSFEN